MVALSQNSIKGKELSFENGPLHLELEKSQLNTDSVVGYNWIQVLPHLFLIYNVQQRGKASGKRQIQATQESFLYVLIGTRGNKASNLLY